MAKERRYDFKAFASRVLTDIATADVQGYGYECLDVIYNESYGIHCSLTAMTLYARLDYGHKHHQQALSFVNLDAGSFDTGRNMYGVRRQ